MQKHLIKIFGVLSTLIVVFYLYVYGWGKWLFLLLPIILVVLLVNALKISLLKKLLVFISIPISIYLLFVFGWFVVARVMMSNERNFVVPVWKIDGRVVNEEHKAVEGVLLDIHGLGISTASDKMLSRRPKESSMTVMTDRNGEFNFQISGDYLEIFLKRSDYCEVRITGWPDAWHVTKPLQYATNATIQMTRRTGDRKTNLNTSVKWTLHPSTH